MKPEKQWLDSLTTGQSLIVDSGAGGRHVGRVSRITDKLIYVRMGKELRKFTRAEGGTFGAPTHSKAWLAPMEIAK